MTRNSSTSVVANWRSSIRHLKAVDPHLGRVIDACGNIKLEIQRRRSPFEFLLRSIIFQQLSGKAAATIHGRFPRSISAETSHSRAGVETETTKIP